MPRSKEEKQAIQDMIYSLDIGDSMQDPISGWQITGVPGGWIYSRNANMQVVFVPDNRVTLDPYIAENTKQAGVDISAVINTIDAVDNQNEIVLPVSRRTVKK